MIFDHVEALVREIDAVSKEYLGFTADDEVTLSTIDRSALYMLLSISTLDNVGFRLKRIIEILGIEPETALALTKFCELFRNPDNALVFRQMVEAIEQTEAFAKVKEAMTNANH